MEMIVTVRKDDRYGQIVIVRAYRGGEGQAWLARANQVAALRCRLGFAADNPHNWLEWDDKLLEATDA